MDQTRGLKKEKKNDERKQWRQQWNADCNFSHCAGGGGNGNCYAAAHSKEHIIGIGTSAQGIFGKKHTNVRTNSFTLYSQLIHKSVFTPVLFGKAYGSVTGRNSESFGQNAMFSAAGIM